METKTSNSVVVMGANDAMPLTVSVPALAVIDPTATIDVLAVTVDVLVKPLIVSTPLLAVIEPKKAAVT